MIKYILLGAIAPLLRSIINYIDKHLLHKAWYPKKHAIPVLMIFSSLIGIGTIILGLVLGYDSIGSFQTEEIILLVSGGLSFLIATFLYLHCLQKESPANVIPYFQFIPLIAIIIGHIFFDEVIGPWGLLGCAGVIAGACLLGFDKKTYKISWNIMLIMFISGIFYTYTDIVYKLVSTTEIFRGALMRTSLGITLGGICLLTYKPFGNAFVQTIRNNGKNVLVYNIINEILGISAKIIFFWLTAFIYIGYLETISSLQPLFLLIIGYILYFFFGEKIPDTWSPDKRVQQLIAILIMIGGVVLISI